MNWFCQPKTYHKQSMIRVSYLSLLNHQNKKNKTNETEVLWGDTMYENLPGVYK